MRVAVTGASGFLGRAVVSALVSAGHDVVGVTRGRPVGAGVEVRTATLERPDQVAAALADVDAACHLAAVVRVRDSLADPLGTWRTNLGGTLAVLDALPRGAPLVLASTAAIVDDRPPPHPYGAAKLAADLAARDVARTGAVGAVSLRFANVAGPGDGDPTRLVPAVLAAAAGRSGPFVVNGDGSAVRDLVHVADAARAVVAALAVATPGTHRAVPVGSGRPVAVREVLDAAGRVTGRPVPVRHRAPAPEARAVTVDPARARDELGWVATCSGLERIVRDAWTES